MRVQSQDTPSDDHASITGYIVWGERIWDSFQAGYIKNLDVEFYYALENTLARRLYRFLDKRMHYQDSYQIDIFDLAARMGMKPYPYASHLARKLKPAFDELQSRGFLARVEASVDLAGENINGSRYLTTSSQNDTEGHRDAKTPARVQTHTRHAHDAARADFAPSAQCQALWAALLAEYQRTLPPASAKLGVCSINHSLATNMSLK
jgi:hypothetical protein